MWEISHTQGYDARPYYFYEPIAGGGSTVYVVDLGFNANLLPEFTSFRLRWLFPQFSNPDFIPWGEGNDEVDAPDNHGTAMVSKVAGRKYGIAKAANIVMVRLPQQRVSGVGLTYEVLLDVLLEIENDVKQNALQGKFVVNMSFSKSL